MTRLQIKAYQNSSLQHASGPELVAACFREARKSLKDARRFIEAGTPASSYTPLERVRKIYTHLYATVDLDAGGELALQMQQLYVWVIDQTISIGTSCDLDQLASLETITTDQLNSWNALAHHGAGVGSGTPRDDHRVSAGA